MGEAHGKLYFAYGSNLWLAQMDMRCPRSPFTGVAVLRGWKWLINSRGYANVVPSPATGDGSASTEEDHSDGQDVVYGVLYRLHPDDEDTLDGYEDVPRSYGKEILGVELYERAGDGKAAPGKGPGEPVDALVYVDRQRQTPDKPKPEYVHRMNRAIRDALLEGVLSWYIDKYLRPFIPKADGGASGEEQWEHR